MTRIKTIGLALIAVFAVMAVTAASAMAANSNPVLVKSNGEAVTNLSVTSSGGESFLQATAGTKAKIECKTEKSTGTATTKLEGNGMTSGSGTVTFTGCKNAAGKCSNKATGEITGTVSTLLVWVGSQANKTIGVLISILPYTGIAGSQNQLLSFKCSGVLIDVQGSLIALLSRKPGELFTTAILTANQAGGVQQDQTYTENGELLTNTLYSNEGGGAFAPAAEQIKSEETYGTSVKIIEN